MSQKKRKPPIRMCIGCRERFDKRELIRVVRTPEGEIVIDDTGKKSGRGAYICPGSSKCLTRAIKSKALERVLERPIDEELYDRLKAQIDEG